MAGESRQLAPGHADGSGSVYEEAFQPRPDLAREVTAEVHHSQSVAKLGTLACSSINRLDDEFTFGGPEAAGMDREQLLERPYANWRR